MKSFLLLLISTAAIAQTAAVPPLPVIIPARSIPSQKVTFSVPRGGGSVTITIPTQTLTSQTTSTAAVAAPVTVAPLTIILDCTGIDMQHLVCTAVKQ